MEKKLYIIKLYNILLQRDPSPHELAKHLESPQDLTQTQRLLAKSAEFKSRFNEIFDKQEKVQNNIPIFIINLKRRQDRKDAISKALRHCGVENFEFITAVDGNEKFDKSCYDDEKARLIHRRLTDQEIACALSHQIVYKKMVKEQIPRAIILEDDAIPTKHLNPFLKNIDRFNLNPDLEILLLAFFTSNNWFNDRLKTHTAEHYLTDQITMSYHPKANQTIENISIHNFSYPSLAVDFIQGAHGYTISDKVASKLLKINTPICCTADDVWNYFKNEFQIVCTSPMLFNRQLSDSDIEENRKKLSFFSFGYDHLAKIDHEDFGR
ncbi:MAG: glycosyltransferase family 25 protein [Chlamydiae bacterium]|nr:glycosyltransferase family 25 protein [Chlamydiota bacterium]